MSNRAYVLGVGVAAVASMLLRLRFVFTPLSNDEGGAVAIGENVFRQDASRALVQRDQLSWSSRGGWTGTCDERRYGGRR